MPAAAAGAAAVAAKVGLHCNKATVAGYHADFAAGREPAAPTGASVVSETECRLHVCMQHH